MNSKSLNQENFTLCYFVGIIFPSSKLVFLLLKYLSYNLNKKKKSDFCRFQVAQSLEFHSFTRLCYAYAYLDLEQANKY